MANLKNCITHYRNRQNNTSNRHQWKLNRVAFMVAYQHRKGYPRMLLSFFSRLLAFLIPQSRYARKAKRFDS